MRQFKFFKGDILKEHDLPGFRFVGCSGLYFDKENLRPYRFKKYIHIETNAVIVADMVYDDNPLFDIVDEAV